jgi:homoserine kinase
MAVGPGPARLRVVVPATSANLGAGFDAVAIALDLSNVVELKVAEPGSLVIEIAGEGADDLPRDRENRFVVALERGLRAAGRPEHGGWHVRMENRIPLGRGLGSSAAASVAGAAAADLLASGALGPAGILAVATELEGHPDNAAAAIHGGFVVVAGDSTEPATVRFDPPGSLRAILFIPERRLATSEMRAVLPSTVPRLDAVHNVGRAALGVAAFATGRLELLDAATDDRLHEPYRAAVFPALPVLVAAARAAGALGACLSGAGSTIIAFSDDAARAEAIAAALRETGRAIGEAGQALVVATSASGVRAEVLA